MRDSLTVINNKTIALRAKMPPQIKVACGLIDSHKLPAIRLAGKRAIPVAKLMPPKAVPLKLAGTWSATKANSKPWLIP